MKICLYLEGYHFLGGALYRNIGTGLLSSYRNQKKILESLNIPYTETWDQSCDILQINTPWPYSWWLIRKARASHKKVIIWAHVTPEDFAQVFWFNRFLGPFVKHYLRYVYGLADAIFCPTHYTRSLLIAHGLPREKLIVQSNGVNRNVFLENDVLRNKTRSHYKLSGMVVGTVGLVIPRKGVDTFLALAREFPSHEFIWFGKIYSALLAKPLPKELPSNVRFTGFVDDIVGALNALDIFIFPSYEENQGMAILEAASVGVPIVVRDIPVYQGWLVHGENCLKAKDDAEFIQCIRTLLKNDALREKLSQAGRDLAEHENLPVLAQATKVVYERLLR
jgi:1,2-diacylglycerol-3-alpha-glucose alpha-1,2-glucosyltransferase